MKSARNIAVVHYHLHPGGVTRVLQHALRALRVREDRFVVLSGEPTAENFDDVEVRVVPELGYARPGERESEEALLQRLDQAARDALGVSPDLWHVHNHSVGKNAALPGAVFRLAQRRDRLLLHLHDFPEDGRPANYRFLLEQRQGDGALESWLYPQAPHVHYAVLNDRDYRLLQEAGARPESLHLLPDPVSLENVPEVPVKAAGEAQPLHLYPTRSIRRKNLGEFLFWSVLASPGEQFAATLAPKNPREIPIYEQWVAFATRHRLPVRFNVGADPAVSFVQWLQAAQDIVTTSVAEGFGLAFLEPWLAGRAVVGRNLPEITQSFQAAGVDLSSLYERLDVPLAWVGRETLRVRVTETLSRSREQYGRQTTPDDVERALSAMGVGESVDFGRLDEELQRSVMERLIQSPEERQAFAQKLTPRLMSEETIQKNRELIQREFSLSAYGKRLSGIYDSVMSSATGQVLGLPEGRLLDGFLDPARFCLLRT